MLERSWQPRRRRSHRWPVVVAGALAAGAVAAAAAPTDDDAPLAVEDILNQPLDNAAYVKPSRCLSAAQYQRVEIVSDRLLVFHGRGGKAWLNVLPLRCAGLRTDSMLSIERRDFRVCARDRVRGASRSIAQMPTIICVLGEFQPVTQGNLEAMRDALAARQRTATVRHTVRSAEHSSSPSR